MYQHSIGLKQLGKPLSSTPRPNPVSSSCGIQVFHRYVLVLEGLA